MLQVLHELYQRHVEFSADFFNGTQGRALEASLKLTNIGAVQLDTQGELFLAHAFFRS